MKHADGARKSGGEKCLGENGGESAGDGLDDEKGKHGGGACEASPVDELEEEIPEEEERERREKHEAKGRSGSAASERENVGCVEVGGSWHCNGRNSGGDESEYCGCTLRDDVETHELRSQQSDNQNTIDLAGYGAKQIGTPCPHAVAEKET